MPERDDFCGSAWDWFATALAFASVFIALGLGALGALAFVIWTVNHV